MLRSLKLALAGLTLGTPLFAAPQPASAPNDDSLLVVHCSMRNTDWLQAGEKIANPYLGSAMLGCGKVTEKLALPTAGANLAPVLSAYLDVAKGLAADKLNSDAVVSFKAAIDRLPPSQYADLRTGTAVFTDAKEIDAARKAFSAVSSELIKALEHPKP